MDVDAVLRELRRAVWMASQSDEEDAEALAILVTGFDDLDKWLSRGGFLPRDWQRVDQP